MEAHIASPTVFYLNSPSCKKFGGNRLCGARGLLFDRAMLLVILLSACPTRCEASAPVADVVSPTHRTHHTSLHTGVELRQCA